MSEEIQQETKSEETSNLNSDFKEIKEVASKNIGSMLRDLQAFEEAIKNENIPEIYRIYKGDLHKEFKEISNQNHEIDELLSRKLHSSFTERFPFMNHVEKISPTVHHYKIDTYYRERPIIAFDASVPSISVLPHIDKEWSELGPDKQDVLTAIEREIDDLDAKVIAAEAEIRSIDSQLKEVDARKTAIQTNKGFFNRAKTEEELAELEKHAESLKQKRAEWVPYVENKTQTAIQKERLGKKYQDTRLKRAVVTKEFRLINQHFGSRKELDEKIQQFLVDYLANTEGADE